MSKIAFVALGSNQGDRQHLLRDGLKILGTHPEIRITRRSSIYQTKPVGGPPGQLDYLNAVAEIITSLSPDRLLQELLRIETQLGRVRTVPDGPRTLDLDLLFYAQEVHHQPELILPHPRLQHRLFVLEPLAEIAPGFVHPLLGKSIQQLRADLLGIAVVGSSPGRELTGLRALVTGSTSGIGKEIALELASAGAHVIVHGKTDRPEVHEIANALQNWGVQSRVLLADLRDSQQWSRLAEEGWAAWDGLDIWINNAGADTLTGEVAQWPFDQKLQELMRVDVEATVYFGRLIGSWMKNGSGGVILNMGWDQAETGMEGDSGEMFALTKGAIMAFSRSLALSLAPAVRVHCLAPGWIRTKWGESASDSWQERVLRETPLQRWGTPNDVAKTVRWLVSPGANYLTGQIIRVNGGAVR